MAEIKTKATKASVREFLKRVAGTRTADCATLVAMHTKVTGAKPQMWGPSIIGFGSCKYRYPDGREMDWMEAAFSPRSTDLVLYLSVSFPERKALLAKLGKHRIGKSCLYIKRLADVDLTVLQQLIERSVAAAREQNA
jgi:Domain of unknown function (DU1801)